MEAASTGASSPPLPHRARSASLSHTPPSLSTPLNFSATDSGCKCPRDRWRNRDAMPLHTALRTSSQSPAACRCSQGPEASQSGHKKLGTFAEPLLLALPGLNLLPRRPSSPIYTLAFPLCCCLWPQAQCLTQTPRRCAALPQPRTLCLLASGADTQAGRAEGLLAARTRREMPFSNAGLQREPLIPHAC